MSALGIVFFAGALLGCEPRQPGEPKPPIPKVDFTHERSTS
jgi:hypothetical protein